MFGRIIALWSDRSKRGWIGAGLFAVALIIFVLAFFRTQLFQGARGLIYANDPREAAFSRWWTGDAQDRANLMTSRTEVCPGAPFLLPASGYIGLLYGDPRGPYSEEHRHQGIDIFSNSEPNVTPVYAAYDGYLTREVGWTSAVIIRVPNDPLHPGRQIWLYYTHMASADGSTDFVSPEFPQDTHEVFVKQGTLLGHTGNWSGNALRPVGTHLHFSIVLDNGFGGYTNELQFDNTVDTSRYLGIPVNYQCATIRPDCHPNPLCEDAFLGAGGG
jgi:murein DD-endopeptidase MepM/ murein hydrolase activator NlpD